MANFTQTEAPPVNGRTGVEASVERIERAELSFVSHPDPEEARRQFFEDYRTVNLQELVARWPTLFQNDTTVTRQRGLVYGLLSHFGIERKRPHASKKKKPSTQARVTPLIVDDAFEQSKPASATADEGMKVLAAALLPYIRDALLDDMVTGFQLVKQARS